jgi:aminopeptidase N
MAAGGRFIRQGDATLLNVSGKSYGFFAHDSLSLAYMMDHIADFDKPLERISILANLNENYLDGRIPAYRFATFLADYIPTEKEELLVSTALGYLGGLALHGPLSTTPTIEAIFSELAHNQALGKAQTSAFKTLAGFFQDPEQVDAIYRIWRDQAPWPGVKLSETDYTTLALELAVRLPERAAEILDAQRGRIGNADRLREFDFVRPAVSPDKAVRDSVFQALLQAENRRHEPWVQTSLRFLNHPLRQPEALDYIRPALDVLQEVQRTGDIFFPKQWVAATLRGHDNPFATWTVEEFLADHPDYPELLRNKVLQAAARGRRFDVARNY